MACVFAYGSLQIAEVMEAVTGRNFPAVPGLLADFARYRLKAHPFPGLRAEPGAETEGTLYVQVDEASLARLDEFEDDFYERQSLPVRTAEGRLVSAEVYVVSDPHLGVLDCEPWSLDEFRRRDLEPFLRTYRWHLGTIHEISRQSTQRLSHEYHHG